MGPLGTCCVCGLSSWLGGDRHGAAGAPHRTQDKGEEPYLEDVVTWRTWGKGRGLGGAQLGAGREDSWEHRGCGGLGWGRGWIWRAERGMGKGGGPGLGKIKVKRVKLAEPWGGDGRRERSLREESEGGA